MQYVDHVAKAHGVDRAICVAIMIIDYLEYARPLALPRLRIRMLAAELRNAKRVSHLVLHRFGECREIALRRADPIERLFAFCPGVWPSRLSQIWDEASTDNTVPVLFLA